VLPSFCCPYANAASRFFFFCFGGGRPLHTSQFLICRNPLDILAARFTNSSPKAFLSNQSDLSSILICRCRLVFGFFIRLLPHSCCLGLSPVCHCCIPGSPNVFSWTSVLSGFIVPHRPGRNSCDRVPCTAPILCCGSSSCRLRPAPFSDLTNGFIEWINYRNITQQNITHSSETSSIPSW
jgi:hypothetical protein